MTNGRILIIEDEIRLSNSICKYLAADGFEFLQAVSAAEGFKLFELHQPDLIVLDIMLPDKDGFSLCEDLRTISDIPIIFLTARIDDADRITGFAKGADDYVCKPFNTLELVSRIKAVIRRTKHLGRKETLIRGTVVLFPDEHRVTVAGSEVQLTQIEFNILAVMMAEPTRVFSRQELLMTAHGKSFENYERIIDTHIKNIRKKINSMSENNFVKTVYGVGYKFV